MKKRLSVHLQYLLYIFYLSIHLHIWFKMVKYHTQEEIAFHNHPDDCWVSIFDQVFDLTELIRENRGSLSLPLIAAAGTSLSHWFNAKTGDLKTYIDPVRNIEMPYTPEGRFIHVPPTEPEDRYEPVALPWWKDPKYIVGKVSSKTMKIKITNMLTRTDHIIKVCKEETLDDIKERYVVFNHNASSYTWKILNNGNFLTLKTDKTLEENGIKDESKDFLKLGVDEEAFLPNLLIYYNDDLHET